MCDPKFMNGAPYVKSHPFAYSVQCAEGGWSSQSSMENAFHNLLGCCCRYHVYSIYCKFV